MSGRTTSTHERVIDAVTQIHVETGGSASVREIGARTGLRSSSTVQNHLVRAEAEGRLRQIRRPYSREAQIARALRVARRGYGGLDDTHGAGWLPVVRSGEQCPTCGQIRPYLTPDLVVEADLRVANL